MPLKHPRQIRGYPTAVRKMLRRLSASAVKWDQIRLPRPRRHARPWKWQTRLDVESYQEGRATQEVRGSLPERIFYQALVDHNLIAGIDFTFQSSMLGGRMQLGGLVADFLFPYIRVIVQVQGYWHTVTLEHSTRDEEQRLMLQNLGYQVLEIWADTIEDPAALDLWIEQNIMTLWGTSSQGLAPGQAGERSWLDVIALDWLARLEALFDEILTILLGPI